MARILLIGCQGEECDVLALVMEFAGHNCDIASTLNDAYRRLKADSYDVLLTDSSVAGDHPEDIVRKLNSAAPRAKVMILSEEALRRDDEVLTHPASPVRNLSAKFSEIRQDQAVLLLLPEKDSAEMLESVPERPGVLNKLAVLYHAQEKYSAAEQLYQRALKIADKHRLFKRVLSFDDKSGQENSRATASILNNLARLYHDQKNFGAAEPLYKRSLAMAEKLYGPRHPKVMQRLSNLAELYRAQGLIDKALEMDLRLK